MNYNIALVPGDGIGPDVVAEAVKVLDKIGEKFGHSFTYNKVLAGGAAIDQTGKCLPQETIDICKAATQFCSAQWADRSGILIREISVRSGLFLDFARN